MNTVRVVPSSSMRMRPAIVATLVSLGLAILKGSAFLFTGSKAMLASTLDSAADVLVSACNALVVRAAARPADEGHPFGHGKLESLASLLQALTIAAGGVFVLVRGFTGLEHPETLDHSLLGLAVASFSLVTSLLLTAYLKRRAASLRSPALDADSRHYAADYLGHLGVIAAFVADAVFHYSYADPVISILIGALIVKSAVDLFLEASQALLDQELRADDQKAIASAILAFSPKVRGFHDLLTRRSGSDSFVQCHVEIDAELSFRQAHEVVEAVRAAIEKEIPAAYVTIHADPWPEDEEDLKTHQPHAPKASASSELRGDAGN